MIPLETFDLLYKFFLSMALGSLIGAEREKSHQQHLGTDFAGIRTFMLITFLGTLSAYLSKLYYDWLLAVIFFCFVIVVLAGYVLSSYFNREVGMTTGLSTLISFIIGVLIFSIQEIIPIILAISLTLILSFKNLLHKFVYNLKSTEFFDTLKFLVIAFVVLPLLRNIEPFGPFNSIDLYEIWIMVVFVSGISYFAYILIKTFGSQKGVFITGLLGGILSSTAVVTTLAQKSKESDNSDLIFASVIACSGMFLRVLIEVSLLNFLLIEKLAFPMILLALIGFLSSRFLITSNNEKQETNINYSSPLMLSPALKFGFFYAIVLIIATILKELYGSQGLIIVSFFSGIIDSDSIAIFIARNSELISNVAIASIILASLINTITKVVIAKTFGSKEFGNKFLFSMLPIIFFGFVFLFFLIGF
ncbi:MAG: MgtC/SapB family protein [Candidatus Woesearchaeota archaeon]